MMYDVAVVGAGPGGSTAARLCAEAGLSTVLIEEHMTIGHPVQCAGLLSIAAFDACRVSRRCILHTLSGAAVYPIQGEPLVFDAGAAKAYAVDRGVLDMEMAERAAEAGAEILLKEYVRTVHSGVLDITGPSGRREIRTRLVIAADGVRSPIARALGIAMPSQILTGIQAEITHEGGDGIVGIYPHASGDFFGWLIPIGRGRARIGLLGRERIMERFTTFFSRFGKSFTALVTGAVPLGPRVRTYADGVMLIGDAAGLAKPTSGGGVYTAVRSAMHAAQVAVECCENGRYDASVTRCYERRWRDDFGHELRIGMHLLELRQRMDPAEIDRIIELLKAPELVSSITGKGDMDRPSRLIFTLLRHPGLLPLAGLLFKSEVRRIIDLEQSIEKGSGK